MSPVDQAHSYVLIGVAVLELDSSLCEAYEMAQPHLRLDDSEIDVTDSPSTILKRFSLSALFEKSRCMLHRKFLMKARENPEYQYSKQVALDTSIKLLNRQGLVHQVASPGGPFALDRWFLSSLSTPNFLLAAMTIYVNTMDVIKKPCEMITNEVQTCINALERSYNTWEAALTLSPDAKKGI